MKKLVSISLIVALAGVGALFANAANGEKVFNKLGCTSCHDPVKDQLGAGLGPSLKMIADAYNANGGRDKLLHFFDKGKKSDALIDPKKFNIMKTQLKKVKKLSDAEKGDLADFILTR